MGLLHATSCGCRLASCLGGQLLAGGLAARGLACGLLGASHVSNKKGFAEDLWVARGAAGASCRICLLLSAR